MNANKQKIKHGAHQRGVKLFFFGRPQGQKHKHKKNKYYVSHLDGDSSHDEGHKDAIMGAVNLVVDSKVCHFRVPTSIMSGDSPMHNNRTADAFDFASPNQPVRPQLLDPKSLSNAEPVATTSKDAAVQSGPPDEKGAKGEVQASVLVEPGGKDENGDFGSSTWLNGCDNTVEGENNVERRNNKDNDGDYHGKDKKDKFRKNGNIDRLDGVWVPKEEKQKEEQEDNCIVKCLYVTMTCCECSIM